MGGIPDKLEEKDMRDRGKKKSSLELAMTSVHGESKTRGTKSFCWSLAEVGEAKFGGLGHIPQV